MLHPHWNQPLLSNQCETNAICGLAGARVVQKCPPPTQPRSPRVNAGPAPYEHSEHFWFLRWPPPEPRISPWSWLTPAEREIPTQDDLFPPSRLGPGPLSCSYRQWAATVRKLLLASHHSLLKTPLTHTHLSLLRSVLDQFLGNWRFFFWLMSFVDFFLFSWPFIEYLAVCSECRCETDS